MAGGSQFNYSLLWVVTLGTLMLITLQSMAAKLGIVTGKSLAKNVKERYSPWLSTFFGATIVFACVATDVAELLGGIIGFHLLLGFPYWLGALITIFLEFYFIFSQRYHSVERIIIGFLSMISLSYVIELFIVKPSFSQMVYHSVVPSLDGKIIYVAMGILGAIVMPHNIYLHSNKGLVRWLREEEKADTLRTNRYDPCHGGGMVCQHFHDRRCRRCLL